MRVNTPDKSLAIRVEEGHVSHYHTRLLVIPYPRVVCHQGGRTGTSMDSSLLVASARTTCLLKRNHNQDTLSIGTNTKADVVLSRRNIAEYYPTFTLSECALCLSRPQLSRAAISSIFWKRSDWILASETCVFRSDVLCQRFKD